MENVTPLGGDVYEIDTRLAGHAGITAGYLILGDRPCLVETGTSTSAPVVRDALASLGVGAGDLATVVVTHIHLDHAGGVGDIAGMFPAAEIVVHEKGARHLADPSRLMSSARMVWGERLDTLFGMLKPTDATRIRALGDTGAIDLGNGRRLTSHYSPGHAKHHVGLVDSLTGDLYVGDAAGVYIPDTGDVRPSTPPPDFDLETALASIALFEALGPQRLLFSHYGPVDEVGSILERSAEELLIWVDLAKQAKGEQLDLDHAVAMVDQRTRDRYARPAPGDKAAEHIEMLSGTEPNLAGIMHWLDRPKT
ncbi:MBL fold metallo-hydrolase [Herbidospora sp. NBRC 101105]|uniref:MBL fold metallo-hydrolase n=1 Tax=Herbidospora sp. NBRC 101105 TaxID=3032195 RepID=UPI0024A3CCA5|nr:MBL fold metallo-hydrolase [Herbidospora sp. NBRC 101105]GLX96816.1 MBL fold metallo-hydrolase [Herbidospora sp. NBRC 101105]